MANIYFITEQKSPSEPDLIAGNEHKDVVLVQAQEEIFKVVKPPKDGWDHDALLVLSEPDYSDIVDAYFGDPEDGLWIGSTEC